MVVIRERQIRASIPVATSMKTLLSVFAASFVLASAASAVEPVNAQCPVCGKNVRLIFHSNFKNQRVAFATAECKDKFDKSPTKYAVKPK